MAETDLAALRLTVQDAPLLLVQPVQPVTAKPATGVAVRVTVDPVAKLAEHSVPQLMPAGALVMLPFPEGETVRRLVAGAKFATTALAALMVTEQFVPLALVQPVQLENT
ncbi:MAG TPA: hypothetical protein DCY52_01020 [Methylococcaceae bacterium]|nr:hypothetical protein [Methylococcaceae bacterium]